MDGVRTAAGTVVDDAVESSAGEGGTAADGGLPSEVTGRAVWHLLLRGLTLYLPGWVLPGAAAPVTSGAVRPPAFLGPDGFGLQLPGRAPGLPSDREIYVRGRSRPSFGIVIAGPAQAAGTRVLDAAALLRFARRLVFDELCVPQDAESVPYAVRAVRAVENVVLLDRAAGVGLCAEVDPATGRATCPALAVFGNGASGDRTIRAYVPG